MSKIDLECFPHVVDLIWEFLPDHSLHIAGQVCRSWRYRAQKRLYHHLSAAPTYQGWVLAPRAKLSKNDALKYFLPHEDSEIQKLPSQPRISSNYQRLDAALAARTTEAMDLIWYVHRHPDIRSPISFLKNFSRLQTLRVHSWPGQRVEGIGATQVYGWFPSADCKTRITAHNAERLVLLHLEDRSPRSVLEAGNLESAGVLERESYSSKELIVGSTASYTSLRH